MEVDGGGEGKPAPPSGHPPDWVLPTATERRAALSKALSEVNGAKPVVPPAPPPAPKGGWSGKGFEPTVLPHTKPQGPWFGLLSGVSPMATSDTSGRSPSVLSGVSPRGTSGATSSEGPGGVGAASSVVPGDSPMATGGADATKTPLRCTWCKVVVLMASMFLLLGEPGEKFESWGSSGHYGSCLGCSDFAPADGCTEEERKKASNSKQQPQP